jgi:hypothetical protein
VTEGHHDLRTAGARAQELDDLAPQARPRFLRENRDPLRVEQHHACPADPLAPAVGGLEIHHEEIPLMVQGVPFGLELGQRLAAELLQDGEVLLPSFQGLLHRDETVSEYPCVGGHAPFSQDVGRRR